MKELNYVFKGTKGVKITTIYYVENLTPVDVSKN